MIGAAQLAEIVSRRVKLRRIGQERWRGLCPFHGPERTPSFDVFTGRDDAGHYYCHSCQESGTAEWWLRKMENKSYREAGGMKPDPKIEQERKERQRRLQLLNEFRDRNPECPIPDAFLLNHPDWMTTA